MQAVTIVGRGSFSSFVAVTVGGNEESESSFVIGLAVTIVALVILLTTVAGLLSAHVIALRIRYVNTIASLHTVEYVPFSHLLQYK